MSKLKSNNLSVFLLFTAYVVLVGLARVLLAEGIEVDEAEQSYLSQSFLWGYNIQPPLYTWLQMSFLQVFGNHGWVYVLFRMMLLLLTFHSIFLIFYQISGRKKQGIASAFLCLLLIQFSTESLRQTHTVLVTLTGNYSLWCLIQIKRSPKPLYYLLLGIALAAGILAKYNFLLFIFSLSLVVLLIPHWRKMVFSSKTLLTAVVILVLTAPHFIWIWQHLDALMIGVEQRMSAKTTTTTHSLPIGVIGSFKLLKGLLSFLSVFLIVFALTHWRRFRALKVEKNDWTTFFEYFFLISVAQFLLLTLVFGMTSFPERWIQPFFIFFPGYCLLKFYGNGISPYTWKVFKQIGGFAAIAVIIVVIARTAILPSFQKPVWLNKPHLQFCEDLRPILEENKIEVIVTKHIFLAGYFRIVYPDFQIITLDTKYVLVSQYDTNRNTILLWTWAWVEGKEDGVYKGRTPELIQQQIQQHPQTPIEGGMKTYDYHYCPSKKSSYNYFILGERTRR